MKQNHESRQNQSNIFRYQISKLEITFKHIFALSITANSILEVRFLSISTTLVVTIKQSANYKQNMAKSKVNDKSSKSATKTQEGDTVAEQTDGSQGRPAGGTEGKRKGQAASRSRQRIAAGAGKNKNAKEDKKENALDDAEMYIDLNEKQNTRKKAIVDLRASAQRSLMNTAEQQREANMKLSRKKRNQQKMKRFAETIGVEDNNSYPKCKDKEKLIMNVSASKYFVVRFVAKHLFNYKLSFKPLDDVQTAFNYEALIRPSQHAQEEDWDIYWTDNSVQPERIAKMKPYQKTNHFPGMFQLSRKNHLARNLIKMSKKFPKEYKFFPRTFLLPAEWGEFKNSFANKALNMRPIYIVKPEASCQGKGIFLVNGPEEVKENDHYVVQQYIKKPLLIDGLKFDCRLYVLVLSVDPLRVYLFKEGLARFSTDRYQQPSKKNLSNLFMHLTNYSINSKNKGVFQFNKNLDEVDTGHKRTFTSILDWIGANVEDGERKKEKMMLQIEQIIIRTLCTVQPSLKHYLQIPNKAQYINDGVWDGSYQEEPLNSMCFEILGFDILIDEKLKPWLIEINHAPSFGTDTCLDFKIKKDLLADTMQLLSMSYLRKRDFQRQHRHYIQKRMLSYGRSKYAAYPGNKQSYFNKNGGRRDSSTNYTGIFGSPGGQPSLNAVGGDYINNSGIAGAGRRRDQSFSNATTTTTATNAVNVDELEKELFGKHGRTTHQPAVAGAATTTQGAAESGSKGGATSEKKNEEDAEGADKNEATGAGAEDKEGEEGDDCSESRDDEVEDEEALAGEEAVEEEPEVKVRENQYKLIYPSRDNTEFEYRQYISYANQLYEQFTGSYSKKTSRTDIQPLNVESKSSTYGSPSPIKHQSASQPPKQTHEPTPNRQKPSAEKESTSQLSSIVQAQRDFLQVHNDLLQEVSRRKGQHNVQQHQYMNIKEQVQQSAPATMDRSASFVVGGWAPIVAGGQPPGAGQAQAFHQRPLNSEMQAKMQQQAAQHANKGLNFSINPANMPYLGSPASYTEKMTAAVTGKPQMIPAPTQESRAVAQSLGRQQTAEMQRGKSQVQRSVNQMRTDSQPQLLGSALSQTPQANQNGQKQPVQFNQTYSDQPDSSRDFVLQRFHNAPNNPSSLVSPLSVAPPRQMKGPDPLSASFMKMNASAVGGGHSHGASPGLRLQNQKYQLGRQLQTMNHSGTLNQDRVQGREGQQFQQRVVDAQNYPKVSWHAPAAHGGQTSWENAFGVAFGANKRAQAKPQNLDKNLSEPTPGGRGPATGNDVIHIENQVPTEQHPGFLMPQKQQPFGKHLMQDATGASATTNLGKSSTTNSGDVSHQRVAQSAMQYMIQRSQNAKSVMVSQEAGGATAATITHSLTAAHTSNKIQAVNPKLSFASPSAEAARLKQNKTISANRGVAPGDIVMQMSSPPTKLTAATDSKTEAKRSLPLSRQGVPESGAAAQQLQPHSLLRRLDYVEAPAAALQPGTFEIHSARKADDVKARDGEQKYCTGSGEAMRGGRDAEGALSGEGQTQSLSCQPSASRLARGLGGGQSDPPGPHTAGHVIERLGGSPAIKGPAGAEAKHLREQTNEYLKSSNIANKAPQKASNTDSVLDPAQLGARQPKSLSMKAKSNASEPHGRPSDLQAVQFGNAQAQSISGMRPQLQHPGQYDNQSLYTGLNTFKDISDSLKALGQGAGHGQQKDRPAAYYLGAQMDSARRLNGSMNTQSTSKSGNSRLFSHYVRDFIHEQQLTQGKQALHNQPLQDPSRANLLGSIHELQQALQGKGTHLGHHFGSAGGAPGQPAGAVDVRELQRPRQSSLTHNFQFQRPQQFKPASDGAASTSMSGQVMHKDYRNEHAFFNKIKMAPHGTPGAAAIGNLFAGGPGGKKLAASSQDHSNAGGLQKRDISVPDFVLSLQHYTGAQTSSAKYSGRMAHAPSKGSGYLPHDQHAYHGSIHHMNSQGMALVHPRQTKKRTLNIKQS